MLGFSPYMFAFRISDRTKLPSKISYSTMHPRCTGVIRTRSSWNIIGVFLFRSTVEIKEFEKEFFGTYHSYVHDHEMLQIIEQPHYKQFIEELLSRSTKKSKLTPGYYNYRKNENKKRIISCK